MLTCLSFSFIHGILALACKVIEAVFIKQIHIKQKKSALVTLWKQGRGTLIKEHRIFFFKKTQINKEKATKDTLAWLSAEFKASYNVQDDWHGRII